MDFRIFADPSNGASYHDLLESAKLAEHSRIRLGSLVRSVASRHPGPLAIVVAQVDTMSEGRIEFGLGAGYFEPEHVAYGIPSPPVAERFDRLGERCR